MFKYWSQTSQSAMQELSPDLGLRNIDDLSLEERGRIYIFLYKLIFLSWPIKQHIEAVVYRLNEMHKTKAVGPRYLSSGKSDDAEKDLVEILKHGSNNLTLEALSVLAGATIDEDPYIPRDTPEGEKKKLFEKKKYEVFDPMIKRLNEIFEDFHLDVTVTRLGLMKVHDEKIIDAIYRPVIASLSDKLWAPVNGELRDAFDEFKKGAPRGYSGAITHCHNALEGFLQIRVHGKTGTGTLGSLVPEAMKEGLIPNDDFSREILGKFEKLIQKSRKKSGNGHTKEEYADQKSAMLVMDVTMVALRHCLSQ